MKVLRFAFKRQIIPFDPTIAVRRPRPDTQEALFLSVEEINTLAAELIEQPPYDLAVRFLAITGLRAGEFAALGIRDIDLMHQLVDVQRSMTHTSAGYVTAAPKTASSVRKVPILDDALLADLARYLDAHPRRTEPDAGLWPGKVPGHSILSYDHALDPKGFYRYTFKPAARRAGFPELKLHELRHTFAALSLEFEALSMYELSVAMGHSSYVVTAQVYAHLGRRDYSASRARFSARMATRRPEPIEFKTLRIVDS